MIRNLRLVNFKSWQDSGDIPLAPITVFCGTNSSGKSSIGQLLLLLKQTLESDDRSRVLHFGDSESILDLGNFRETVHDHREREAIGFSLSFDPTSPLEFSNPAFKAHPVRHHHGPFGRLSLSCEIRMDARSEQVSVERMDYACSEGQNPVAFEMRRGRQGNYELTATGYELKRRKNSKELSGPNKFHGFPADADALYSNADFLPDLSLQVYELLAERFFYVGPLRQYPERVYAYTGERPPHVGYSGERAVHALLAARDRKIAFFRNKGFGNRMAADMVVAEWLQRMGLIHGFRIAPIVRGRKEHEVKIRISEGSSEVLITDVGFGISQVLPVLVQSIYADADATVLFEQPEIHLHPSVQSELADVFIEARRIKEDGRERHTQFIIESHSEHLIRRLQRRVAEDRIPASDVAIYFVTQDAGKARIERLEIDEYGTIRNWPRGFFGDELEDLTQTALAAIEKKKRGLKDGKDR
jgi:predicted ATPase